ncbi:peptidyl-prolyl cis-trans isomerase [Armillaria borealis]|uniref:peptidylprolyl isomerase n=1 Tax=Armillaria borealis TaxID=47425 RepID=A0AA39JIQ7_9AGAR|nr:peptidyl-prolyl cis-trans isomerase [Armillaria borealis]
MVRSSIQAGIGTHLLRYKSPDNQIVIHFIYCRGHPFVTEIGVGKVIKGWDEAVPQLSLGQKARLVASADYAYGSRGFPPVIPPNSTLTFEVELLKIN